MLGYFDFLQTLGWTLTGTAAEADEEDSDSENSESTDADAEAEADGTEKVVAERNNKPSNAEKLEAEVAVANARPQALHQLQLQLSPNQTPRKFEHIAWEPQGSRSLAFAPIDSTDECRAKLDEESGDKE